MSVPRTQVLATLLVLALILLPFGRGSEWPMLTLAIFGVLALARKPAFRSMRCWCYLGLLYAFFAIPMVLALPGAVAPEKSLLTTVGSLRFVLFCCAMLWLVQYAEEPRREQARVLDVVGLASALLLVFWCLDGLLQFVTGANLLGYRAGEGVINGARIPEAYVNGVFGEDDNIKFGITTALLFPLGLVHAVRRWPLPLVAGFVLLVLALILLSGKRGAWIIATVELGFLALYYLLRGRLRLRQVAVLGSGVALALLVAVGSSDWVRERSQVLMDAARQPDYATLNRASGKRLPIWRTAVVMGYDNWLNGVGPRGFRYAYPRYAQEGDSWAAPAGAAGGSKSSHAHQLLLELWTETGVIGLAGYIGILAVLWLSWLRASDAARSRALPFAAALFGMLFPINTHAAWYSSWSGLLFWLFVGLYLFGLRESTRAERTS